MKMETVPRGEGIRHRAGPAPVRRPARAAGPGPRPAPGPAAGGQPGRPPAAGRARAGPGGRARRSRSASWRRSSPQPDGIGQPAVARDRRREGAGRAHARHRAGAQQPVAAQQIAGRRGVRPGGEFAPGSGGRPAPRERGRCDVEHGGAEDDHARAARVAEQEAVADVQRQRLAQGQPGDAPGAVASPRAIQQADIRGGPGRADVHGHVGGRRGGTGDDSRTSARLVIVHRPALDQGHAPGGEDRPGCRAGSALPAPPR